MMKFKEMRVLTRTATVIAAGLLCLAQPALAEPVASAASPDGSISVEVSLDNDGRAQYSISRKGKLLIAPSKLGFILTDRLAMNRGFRFEGSETGSSDETWELPWGERRQVRNHYTELLVRFRQPTYEQHRMNLRFRVFDGGIGFRYEIPEQDGLATMNIADELTEFDVAGPGKAWWITGGEWNRYEQNYQETAISAVSTAHTP